MHLTPHTTINSYKHVVFVLQQPRREGTNEAFFNYPILRNWNRMLI